MGQGPGTKRINAKRKAKAKTDAQKYLSLSNRGYSISDIARMCGVSKSTVSTRISAECGAPSEGVEERRDRENAKYDAWEKRLNRLARSKSDDPEVVLQTHSRLVRIAELRIKLNGIAVPVVEKINLEVTAGVASPAKAREAMRSAFGVIGPESTNGSDAGDNPQSVGADAAQRTSPPNPPGEPPAV